MLPMKWSGHPAGAGHRNCLRRFRHGRQWFSCTGRQISGANITHRPSRAALHIEDTNFWRDIAGLLRVMLSSEPRILSARCFYCFRLPHIHIVERHYEASEVMTVTIKRSDRKKWSGSRQGCPCSHLSLESGAASLAGKWENLCRGWAE